MDTRKPHTSKPLDRYLSVMFNLKVQPQMMLNGQFQITI